MMQKSPVMFPAYVFAAVSAAGSSMTGRSRAGDREDRGRRRLLRDAGHARRGVYDTSCAGCHRPDLGGGNGPALQDERFARKFAGKDLKTFYTKVATTMPRNAAASLGEPCISTSSRTCFRENGFPAGDGSSPPRRSPASRAAGKAQAASSGRRFLVRRSGGMPDAGPGEHMAADQRERAGRAAVRARR